MAWKSSLLLTHSCGRTATKAEAPRQKNDDLYHILLENLKLVNITLNRDGFGFPTLWWFSFFLNGSKHNRIFKGHLWGFFICRMEQQAWDDYLSNVHFMVSLLFCFRCETLKQHCAF